VKAVNTRQLSALEPRDLRHDALMSPYGKWSSLCRLRELGLPTLDAVILHPAAAREEVAAAVTGFASHTGVSKVMVRSDGGPETADYYHGGSSHAPGDAVAISGRLLEAGRAVILMEPTDRVCNRLTANTTVRRDALGPGGRVDVEFLGRGYDASDLKRGNIKPQLVMGVRLRDLAARESVALPRLEISRYCDERDERERRGRRLRRLADSIGTGQQPAELSVPDPPDQTVSLLLGDAQVIAGGYQGAWRCLSASCSELDDGRLVYWEIVDGAAKWRVP
jgi:hypothetical protein